MRAQITAFVLIGLGLVLVVLLLLGIRSLYTPTETASTPEGYLERCVDAAAVDAMLTIAVRGGAVAGEEGYGIMLDSGYPLHPPSSEELLADTSLQYDRELQDPYPWPSIPLAFLYAADSPLSPWRPFQYDGPFGQLALPPLCDAAMQADCPLHLYGWSGDTREPVQRQLKTLIEAGIASCIDVNDLSVQFEPTTLLGSPNVSVRFTRQSTVVDAEINLENLGGFDVSRRYTARWLTLYDYAYRMFRRDTKDIFFDVTTSHPEGTSLTPLVDQVVVSPELRRVSVVDPQSTLEGEPLALQILVENRQPVMEITELDAQENIIYVSYDYADPDEDELEVVLSVKNRNGRSFDVPINTLSQTRSSVDVSSLPEAQYPSGEYWLNVSVNDGLYNDWEMFVFNRLPDEETE